MAMRAATTTAIPRHTTHHHLSCISQTAVFFYKKSASPRKGGQFRQQITVEWVNKKKRPQTDLYFNKI